MFIEIRDLTQIYMGGTPFEKKALDHVTITIKQGEFVGLIGHTGSGKSTLIQHFNALLKPDSGIVKIDGVDIFAKGTSLKEIRQKVGLVFQYPEHQLFEATVFKEIAYGPTNLGLSEEEITLRVKRAMNTVGLTVEYEELCPFELSGGQKRRVAIASVLAMEPRILILDEPTAGLDPKGKNQILQQILHLHKEYGFTTILVSHSMEEIAQIADRILVMHQGRVKMDGTPKEIFTRHKELTEIGLDVPRITKVISNLKTKGFTIPDHVITVQEAKEYLLPLLKKGDIDYVK